MVSEDVFHTEKGSSDASGRRVRWAAPFDRLAAHMVDAFTVLVPACMLATAIFRRQFSKYILMENHEQIAFYGILIFLIVFLTSFAYQCTMIKRFGATLGKMFLGVKVVDAESYGPVTWTQVMMRQSMWLATALAFFIPALAVFNQKKRRPIHDRVAETVVVCSRGSGVAAPTFVERKLFQLFYTAFFSVAAVVVFYVSFFAMKILQSQTQTIEALESEGQLCEAVGEAEKKWPENKDTMPDRLSVAMGLYAAGQISSNCLASELQWHFQQGYDSDIAYLAGSFVFADQPEISNRYLQQVCTTNSKGEACHLSRIVDYWSSEDWDDVNTEFKSMPEKKSIYVQIWNMRHQLNQGQFDDVLKTVTDLTGLSSLAPFLNFQRIKAYWGQERYVEAKAVADGHRSYVDEIDQMEVDGWLCYHSQMNSCGEIDRGTCDRVLASVKHNKDWLADTQLALSVVKTHFCGEGKGALDRISMSDDMNQLIDAVENLKSGNKNVGQTELRDLITSEETERVLRFEATRQLLDKSTVAQVEDLFIKWKTQPHDIYWAGLGEKFLQVYKNAKSDKSVLEIAQLLMSTKGWHAEWGREAVVAAYRMGDLKVAQKELAKWPSESSRTPASTDKTTDDFETIRRKLQNR